MENPEHIPTESNLQNENQSRRETAHPFNKKNLTTLKGRMGRLDFAVLSFSLILFTVLLQKFLGINVFLIGISAYTEEELISKDLIKQGVNIGTFSLILFALLSVKRLHDINYSGALAFIFLVPLVNLGIISFLLIILGFIIRLILLFAKGEPTNNRYGPIPDGNKRNKLFLLIGLLVLIFVTYSNLYQAALPTIEPIIEQLVEEVQNQ